VRVRLPCDLDPALAVLHLRGDAHPRALLGDWAGRTAVLASEPVEHAADPFALEGGTWLGGLHFPLAHRVEALPPAPPRPVALPDHTMARFDHLVVRDRDGAWWFEAEGDDHPRLDLWRARLAAAPEARPYDAGPLVLDDPARHLDGVRAVRERIAAGDVFQVNLCLRLEGAWRDGDPLDLLARAAAALRPRHAAYVAGPWGALCSLSPERFLRREGRAVLTEPIKGTGPEPAALARSAKDRAENVMIADLMRNDLGRVCAFGSVHVEALAEPRPGPGVWHLVSSVRGTLRDDASDGDLLRATFPPGSCTGAPKVAATAAIHALEATGREAYTGAIGLVAPDRLDLNVAIRTFEVAQGRVWFGAGGGVTYDSDPGAELAEALAKAAGPAHAAGLRIRARPDGPAVETVRVLDGEPQHLGRHLARLGRPDLEAAARAAAHGTGRLRIAGGVPTMHPEPPPEGDVVLHPVVWPGGLGPVKHADRRLHDALGPALLVDADGSVLEATWASVAAPDGRTPPADGRILPGVTRARALEAGLLREAPLRLDDLRDGLVVLSAVGGPRPAALHGGAPGAGARALAAALRAHLGFETAVPTGHTG
jgi:para-aminobenzoate synthetase / 4-amino-4-deoxychorismate lyase